jgi:molecular chaperone GrpE
MNDPKMTAAEHDPAGEAAMPADSMSDLMAGLEAEKLELKDKVLRTLADMENLRRRTEKEIADAKVYAVTGFARDMLSVADNLRRAMESLGAGGAETLDGKARTMAEGVDLTERELVKTLDRHGVKKLEPLGQRFDPNMHQAMFEAPDPTHPKGHVVAVVQSGYAIGSRVLRPALVGVSSGAAKAEPKADEPPAG